MNKVAQYEGLDKIELVGKKGDLVTISEFRDEDNYYDLTSFSKSIKINMHNFNRSVLVNRAKKEGMKVDGNPLIKPSLGNGGKTLIHPVLMVSVIRSLSIEDSLRMDTLILENL